MVFIFHQHPFKQAALIIVSYGQLMVTQDPSFWFARA